MALRALATINLAAVQRNVALLRGRLQEGAQLCAVVKAQASGHGAVAVAQAALDGGAVMLGVATADEATELREAGITEPVMIMGALSDEELPLAVGAAAELVAWDGRFVKHLTAVARDHQRGIAIPVHVKLDSGMGRLGTRSQSEALAVAEAVAAAPGLALVGVMTHLATADDDQDFVEAQLRVFGEFVKHLQERVGRLRIHAANSAATLRTPASHFDMVRCGIALHGCDPMNLDPAPHGLEPALELSSYIAAVKRTLPGQSAGYGRRFIAERETCIATLPIGYGDGIRRALTDNCDVLIDGRRYPVVGTVSMDNVTVDLGPQPAAGVGASAIFVGRSGDERQTIEDLANRVGTINHEILTGLSSRVHRRYHRDGQPP